MIESGDGSYIVSFSQILMQVFLFIGVWVDSNIGLGALVDF